MRSYIRRTWTSGYHSYTRRAYKSKCHTHTLLKAVNSIHLGETLATMAIFLLILLDGIAFAALFFGTLIFALLIACKLNAHFGRPVDTEDTSNSESDRCDVSPVRENEENSDFDRPNSRTSLGLAHCRCLEKDRRTMDWVRDARKICRQLMVMSSSSSLSTSPSLLTSSSSSASLSTSSITTMLQLQLNSSLSCFLPLIPVVHPFIMTDLEDAISCVCVKSENAAHLFLHFEEQTRSCSILDFRYLAELLAFRIEHLKFRHWITLKSYGPELRCDHFSYGRYRLCGSKEVRSVVSR
uniref:Transmembrane protein n=2 Tax=Loa loa TaxID=7209 RepID=A0A1I7VUG3_LOALO